MHWSSRTLFSILSARYFVLFYNADCSGDSQAGFKWLKKAGYEMPQDVRLEYDQKLYYVTVTFTVDKELATSLPIPGGYENAGWIYTFVPHYNLGNAGFVIGKMDNDTSKPFMREYVSGTRLRSL